MCRFSEEHEHWHELAEEAVGRKGKEGSWARIGERQQNDMSHIQNARVVWGGSVHLEWKRREHFRMEQVVNRLAATRHAKAVEVEEDNRLNCLANSLDMYRVGLVRA